MSMEPLPSVGARVAVVINRQSVHGIVRYVGEAEFKEGTWIGLELDTAIGKNDGSIQGVRYFTCADKHGIFALPKMLQKIEEEGGKVPAVPEKNHARRRSERVDRSPPSRASSGNRANSERPRASHHQHNHHNHHQRIKKSTGSTGSTGSTSVVTKPRSSSEPHEKGPGLLKQHSGCSDGSDDTISIQGGKKLNHQCSAKEVKAQLADAIEEHDIESMRSLLVAAAAMQDSPELVSEIQHAGSILQYEVQQKMLREQQEVQQQLMSNQMEFTRLLKELGEGPQSETAHASEQDRLKQQVAKMKAFDNHVGRMQKAAFTRSKAFERQLEDMRSDSLGILEALEAKLKGDRTAITKVVARGVSGCAHPLEETRGSADHDRLKSEPEAEAQEVAYEQTLNPHYVLMGAEEDVANVAVMIAQKEAKGQAVQQVLEATHYSTRDCSQAAAIMSFIPHTLKRCIRHKLVVFHQWKVLLETPLRSTYNPILSRFDAAVVFADASGFTRLTETLAQQANGAEKIGDTLNKFFGPVIDLVHKHGGDVVKFSGDALTIIWAATEPAPTMHRCESHGNTEDNETAMAAACAFCLEVQEQIPNFGKTSVPGCNLTLHIGVGFGSLALLQLGGLLGRWEYCVAGNALDQIAIAEPLASPGETVLSTEACRLANNFEFEDLPANSGAPLGYKKLLRMSQDSAPSRKDKMPWWEIDEGTDLEMKLVRRYVPSAVGQNYMSGAAESAQLEEMRRVSVIFVSISGLDPCKDEARHSMLGKNCTEENGKGFSGAKETQLVMRLMQLSIYALEGSVNKFLVDDKGVLLLVVFGLPPLIHFADDPTRAVLCAMRVSDTLRDEGLEGHIGVATGMCWCGVVGAPQRREYTVLGDVVNLSARLMGKAPVNGVYVDAATQEIASRTLQFQDGGEMRMKGKSKPVRVFQFTGIAQGVAGQKRDLLAPLLSWQAWPARAAIVSALQVLKTQSGVVYITGPTGSGKIELTEELRSWAITNGWTLFEGQNLDPSGTFTMPMLSLQQVFRKLGIAVKNDPFWRHRGQELTSMSLGEYVPFHRPSGHTVLYWMLVAMIRLSVGKERCELLEPWAPLLNLVVTQLAFSPRVIAAMQERNEQHVRHERFSELCTAVLDGFSRFGSHDRGTLVVISLRRSTGLLQRRDQHEETVIHAIANLCMRRREESTPQARPLVLAVITPSEGDVKDVELETHARACGSYVEAQDLDAAQTKDYVEHYLSHVVPPTSPKRTKTAKNSFFDKESHKSRNTVVGGRARMGVPRNTIAGTDVDGDLGDDAPKAIASQSSLASLGSSDSKEPPDECAREDMLSQFVFEVTGGNLATIDMLLQDLEEQGALILESGTRVCAPHVKSLHWMKHNIALPEFMVGMAFSTFEQLAPAQKQVLKAASSINGDFSLADIAAALPDMESDKLAAICEELSLPSARTFRKVEKPRTSNPVTRYQFYSRVLRQASWTLVLETQRTIIRQRTTRSRTMHGRRLSALMQGGDLDKGDSDHDSDDAA